MNTASKSRTMLKQSYSPPGHLIGFQTVALTHAVKFNESRLKKKTSHRSPKGWIWTGWNQWKVCGVCVMFSRFWAATTTTNGICFCQRPEILDWLLSHKKWCTPYCRIWTFRSKNTNWRSLRCRMYNSGFKDKGWCCFITYNLLAICGYSRNLLYIKMHELNHFIISLLIESSWSQFYES